jgi:hypothetical protein
MKRIVTSLVFAACIGCLVTSDAALAASAKDPTALRRQCAHLVKLKMGVKETGSANDLIGVRGAVAMVDQCVANGGRLN